MKSESVLMLAVGLLALVIVPLEAQRSENAPALMCYECQSAISNEHCLLTGKITQCRENQGSCQNTVRVQDGRLEIHKGCKQTEACINNMRQNGARSVLGGLAQCSFQWSMTVCRCCCQTSNCNEGALFCLNNRNEAYVDTLGNNLGEASRYYRPRPRGDTNSVALSQHPCVNNPCSNGGQCVRGEGLNYRCECASGWRDSHCNTPVQTRQRRLWWRVYQ